MKDDGEFRRNGEEVLCSLRRLLSQAGDDYGFEVSVEPGALEVRFPPPRPRITATLRQGQRQVWLVSGNGTQKLVWDVVANSFVLEATGQTLQELIEKAISEQVGEDVSL